MSRIFLIYCFRCSYEAVLTLDKEKHKVDGPVYYYVFNSLLISLLVLHIYWWVLIFRMIIAQIHGKGHIGEDVRSGKFCLCVLFFAVLQLQFNKLLDLNFEVKVRVIAY